MKRDLGRIATALERIADALEHGVRRKPQKAPPRRRSPQPTPESVVPSPIERAAARAELRRMGYVRR